MPLAYIRTCMARLQNQRYQRSDNIVAAGRNGLAVEEGFPSLPSPLRGLQTANQRGYEAKALHRGSADAIGKPLFTTAARPYATALLALPDSVAGTASLASWKRCTQGRHTPQPFFPRSGRMHQTGAHPEREQGCRPRGMQLSGDIQQHTMARAPPDSVMSSRDESSIEHVFVFTGRPKLLAAGAA